MTERLAALVPEATVSTPVPSRSRGPGFRDRTRHGGQSSTRSLVSLKGEGEKIFHCRPQIRRDNPLNLSI